MTTEYRANYPGITMPGHPDLANTARLDRIPLPMLCEMMRVGIAVDVPYLHDLTDTLTDGIDYVTKEIRSSVPRTSWEKLKGIEREEDDDLPTLSDEEAVAGFNPNSAEQKAWLLFDIMGLHEGKDLKRTAKGDRFSTSKKQIEQLKKNSPLVKLILQHGEMVKLRSTYTRSLVRKVKFHPQSKCCPICFRSHLDGHYRLHTTFTHTRTATGRVASKSPNLQNIPARTALGQAVRAAFIASPGMRLISADYSQIELRLLAHCAKEPGMIKVFQDGIVDLHTASAMDIQKITDPKLVSPDIRRGAKTVNFGIVYGLSPMGLQAALILEGVYWTMEECEKFIDDYFEAKPGIRGYMHEQEYRANHYGFVWDIWGRVRYMPGVYSCHKKLRMEAGREAGNMPIQSSAGGVMKLGMGAVDGLIHGFLEEADVRPLLTIHDEIDLECPEKYAASVCEAIVEEMGRVVELRVPVLADGKTMRRWEK